MVYLLQPMNLHRHIVTQSPSLHLLWIFSTLWVWKRVIWMKGTHCYSIKNNYSTTLKICTPPLHLPCHNPWQPWSFYYLHSFTSSRMSYSWNYTVCSLLKKIFIFNWSMIVLQYWLDFCHQQHELTSYKYWVCSLPLYICPLPRESPSHFPPIPTPFGYYRAPVWVPWVIQQISHWPSISIYHCTCIHATLSLPLTLSSNPVHKFVLYVCIFMVALQTDWSV